MLLRWSKQLWSCTHKDSVTYTDFINKELVQFAKYDVPFSRSPNLFHAQVLRAIPSLIDGFKPVQRKIMWAAFKRNLKTVTRLLSMSALRPRT